MPVGRNTLSTGHQATTGEQGRRYSGRPARFGPSRCREGNRLGQFGQVTEYRVRETARTLAGAGSLCLPRLQTGAEALMPRPQLLCHSPELNLHTMSRTPRMSCWVPMQQL